MNTTPAFAPSCRAQGTPIGPNDLLIAARARSSTSRSSPITKARFAECVTSPSGTGKPELGSEPEQRSIAHFDVVLDSGPRARRIGGLCAERHEVVRAEPFNAIEIAVGTLFGDEPPA
jgi:hypothetical protein